MLAHIYKYLHNPRRISSRTLSIDSWPSMAEFVCDPSARMTATAGRLRQILPAKHPLPSSKKPASTPPSSMTLYLTQQSDAHGPHHSSPWKPRRRPPLLRSWSQPRQPPQKTTALGRAPRMVIRQRLRPHAFLPLRRRLSSHQLPPAT